MARTHAAQQALHGEADRFEPRLSRGFVRAAEKIRERVSINDLAQAIARGDIRAAMAMFRASDVKDALSPAGTIVKDAFSRGGRAGAQALGAVQKER